MDDVTALSGSSTNPHGAYRDEAETIAARRRELEAELDALRTRDRELRRQAPKKPWALAGRHLLAAASTGAFLGFVCAVTVLAVGGLGGVELDPHAALAHRRRVDTALRHERDLEALRDRHARDAIADIDHLFERRATEVVEVPPTVVSVGPDFPTDEGCGPPACDPVAAAHVTRLADDVFDVDRSAFAGDGFSGTARALPHEHPESGVDVGARLYGIRRTSLLGAMGLMNGDVILDVGGSSVTTDVFAVLRRAVRSRERVRVSVVRRGEPMTLTYLVRG